MIKKRKKVICAMSGGVDSSVSAALLKKAGLEVTGVFMKCWSEDDVRTGICTAEEDEMWARRAASKIGIPFYSVDLVKEYKKRVVEYFVSEYKAGRTPNPDVMCNKEIKFGMFYDMAMEEFGVDYIATGHYARNEPVTYAHDRTYMIREKYTKGDVKLLKGKDPNKDQSYFLWAVAREKFKNVLFPVGGYLKPKVRMLARDFRLPNAERKDSQGICFIGKVRVGNFLRNFIDNNPGEIRTSRGEKLGTHDGLHLFTVGQRKGIHIGGGPPYYVAQKNYAENTLIVAHEYEEALFAKSLLCSNVNWISEKPRFPYRCKVKIRYRHADQDAIIKGEDSEGNLNVEFEDAQRAVTPGQSIVFYKGDELKGGGIIT